MMILAARAILISALVLSAGVSARAEMTAITVEASVRSFDAKKVVLQVNKRRVQVPRSLVKEQRLKKGEALLVTFRGDELRFLFPAEDGSRIPASPSTSRAP